MSVHSGLRSREPFAYYDPDSSCWRMSQPSLPLENLPEPSVTFPRSGMTRNGLAYELLMSVPPMAEPESLFLLGTPRVDMGGARSVEYASEVDKSRLEDQVTALLPTPKASDSNGAGTHGTGGPDLRTALLPTPRATDGEKGGPNQRGSSGDLMLPSAVQELLPTPRATRGGSATETYERGNPTLLGAVTNPPLDDGNQSSDD